jgi:hypothetical protein
MKHIAHYRNELRWLSRQSGETLNAIKGVEAIALEPPVATITMDKHIPTTKLQAA